MNKIITPQEFNTLRQKFRDQNKTVVLCHGVFDLLHYGHIEHLQEAKSQGDILVVSVTAAKYVNKGPGRPYFNDRQRMSFLASIEFVDYVLLSEAVTVHDIVKYVQPDIYVKGSEYAVAQNDVTGNINSEQEIVEKYGGRIYFTKGEVYSSTKLLNKFFGALPDNVIKESQDLRKKYSDNIFEQIRAQIDDFKNLNILVVGDIIIDDYIFCKVQGLTMKDSVMSTLFDFKERYAGGSLAIAKHLANFAGKVTVLSQMGLEQDIFDFIRSNMSSVECRIIQSKNFITPVKLRYLKRHNLRQEYDKLFSINRLLNPKDIKQVDYTDFNRTLEELIPLYDVIVICDYGHGLLQNESIRLAQEKAKFLAVNCQTNSSNYGMNLITKYKRADVFVVDERELNLACGQSFEDNDVLLSNLFHRLGSKYAFLTQGASGALGMTDRDKSQMSAATLHVKDTVGAGDAFYSLALMAAAKNMPVDCATLISNLAGAIKTNLLGNSKSVEKVDLLKFLNTVLNV